LKRPAPRDLAFVAVILAAIGLVEYAYGQAPVPPGADSGHWITTSYSFVGLAHPSDFTDQALLYPPMTFLFLGPLVVLTGSPLSTGFLAGALLLGLFGVSAVHLARRYLQTGPGQLLFVGMAVLNGTTLQMLFWGAYPNFLGFFFFNEGLVFLLAFARTGGFWEGTAFGGIAGLLYLTHDLSFAIFGITVVLTAVFLWFTHRNPVALAKSPGLWVGLALFATAVIGYNAASRLSGVSHPGYLFTNPATFIVDPLGLIFRPFFYAPAFLPGGSALVLPSDTALGILMAASIGLAAVLAVTVRLKPGLVPMRLASPVIWLIAAMTLPSAGFLFHIDTDYPRFAYFFPLPFALALVAFGEFLLPWIRGRPSEGSRGEPREAIPAPRVQKPPRSVSRSRAAPWVVVGLALIVLGATVSVPVVLRAESGYISPSHDQQFLDATDWLHHSDRAGAILTDAGDSQRWAEALTARTAYSSSATWLHFYTDQILTDNLAYWAMSGHYVATDTLGALVTTGYNASLMDAFPQYVAYQEGVPFPMLRLSEASLAVSFALSDGTLVNASHPVDWGKPTYTLSPDAPTLSARFVTPNFTLTETDSLSGNGSALVQLDVLPAPGVQITRVALQLVSPVPSHPGGTLGFAGLSYPGGRQFLWSVRGAVGALPGTRVLTASGTVSLAPDPTRSYASPRVNPNTLLLTFSSPPGGLTLRLALTAPDLSNPAITLSTTLDAQQFLAEHEIRFLLLENASNEQPTISLFETEYGFEAGFQNAEWVVLQR
jgi:hypothetical protein